MITTEDFLQHHGIKGQKWGVRKKSSRGEASDDAKETGQHRGKHASTLSNKQLKAVNERINLEQNYNRLNPKKIERGKRHVTSVLATIGIATTVYNLVNSPAGKAALSVGKKASTAKNMAKLGKGNVSFI